MSVLLINGGLMGYNSNTLWEFNSLLLTMTIYNGFSHWKWWFSIAMLVYWRVSWLFKNLLFLVIVIMVLHIMVLVNSYHGWNPAVSLLDVRWLHSPSEKSRRQKILDRNKIVIGKTMKKRLFKFMAGWWWLEHGYGKWLCGIAIEGIH